MCCRKVFYWVSVVLLLGLVSNASATDVYWTDADPCDHLWSTPGNWSPTGVPSGPDDTIWIRGARAPSKVGPLIDSTVTAVCNADLFGPEFSPPGMSMNITGGSLTVKGFTWAMAGDSPTNCATLNISGGTIKANNFCLGNMWWTDPLPFVTLNMTGGTFNINDTFWWGGRLNLHGGTITITNGVEGPLADPNSLIDIANDGTLILPYDMTTKVNEWIKNGHLTAHGGASTISVEYDPATYKTTLKAVAPSPSQQPKPE